MIRVGIIFQNGGKDSLFERRKHFNMIFFTLITDSEHFIRFSFVSCLDTKF